MNFLTFSIASFSLMFVGCATTPKADLIDPTADVAAEIGALDTELEQAQSELQIDIYAPNSFQEAKAELKSAKDARAAGKSSEKVLGYVGQGKAWVRNARTSAERARSEFPDVDKERRYAMQVGAHDVAKWDFRKADREFKNFTEEFEEGKIPKVSTEDHAMLQNLYTESAKRALREKYMKPVEDVVKEAENKSGDDLMPRTYRHTERVITEAQAFLISNFRDEEAVRQKAAEAKSEADHLLALTNNARSNERKSIESITLEMEGQQNQIAQEQTRAGELERQNQASGAAVVDAGRMAAAYEAARSKFTEDEAEVLQKGEALIIRLRGIDFKPGKAELSQDDIALLNRLEAVVAEYKPGRIRVEGHTDATGSKARNRIISAKRAEAVKTYLEGNTQAIDGEKVAVTAVGVGSARPLSPNTSARGRAQNRRVDVVLFSETAPAH